MNQRNPKKDSTEDGDSQVIINIDYTSNCFAEGSYKSSIQGQLIQVQQSIWLEARVTIPMCHHVVEETVGHQPSDGGRTQ
jgi:hypothetical protein